MVNVVATGSSVLPAQNFVVVFVFVWRMKINVGHGFSRHPLLPVVVQASSFFPQHTHTQSVSYFGYGTVLHLEQRKQKRGLIYNLFLGSSVRLKHGC